MAKNYIYDSDGNKISENTMDLLDALMLSGGSTLTHDMWDRFQCGDCRKWHDRNKAHMIIGGPLLCLDCYGRAVLERRGLLEKHYEMAMSL